MKHTIPLNVSQNLSVIIPVYNRESLVSRAIESVLQQTRPPLEIIVVDDGSTDGTSRVLEQYAPHIRILRQSHRGVSAARNLGIKKAKGDWIALLDSDDTWLPQKLAMAEEFHRQHPEYLIFQTEEIWIRNGRRVNPKKKHRKYGGWIFRQALPLCIVSPSAVVFHKSLVQKVGLFDESFPVCEDYDLWLRVARVAPVGLDSRPGIVKYGGHADQLSRQYWGMDYFRVLAMEKHLSDPTLPSDLRRALLEEILFKLKVLLTGYRKRGKTHPELEEKWEKYQQELARLNEE